MRVRSKSISSIRDWWGVQESIIDAEYLIPISNACICDRQVHRRVQARDRRMLISTGGPVTECCMELELAENYLRDLERGDFIERMAFYIAEINAPPFPRGKRKIPLENSRGTAVSRATGGRVRKRAKS